MSLLNLHLFIIGKGGEGCILLSSKIPIFKLNLLNPRDAMQLSEKLFAATVGGNQLNASLRVWAFLIGSRCPEQLWSVLWLLNPLALHLVNLILLNIPRCIKIEGQ